MIKTKEGEREHTKENKAVLFYFGVKKRANVSKHHINLYETVSGTNLVCYSLYEGILIVE